MKSKLLVFFCLLAFSTPFLVYGQVSGTLTPAQRNAISGGIAGKNDVPAFKMMVGIPGVPDEKVVTENFGDYINALYRLSISVAALLAVFKIVIAGAKYMLDDVVTHKSEAKAEIQGALVGLLVILSAFLVLNTINTDITKNIIAIDPVVGADSRPLAEQAFAEAKKMFDSCNQIADATKGERCVLTAMSKADCAKQKNGEFIPGGTYLQTWLRNANPLSDGTNNTTDNCSYIKTLKPGDNADIALTGDLEKDKAACETSPDYKFSAVKLSDGFSWQDVVPQQLIVDATAWALEGLTNFEWCTYKGGQDELKLTCESDPQNTFNTTTGKCEPKKFVEEDLPNDVKSLDLNDPNNSVLLNSSCSATYGGSQYLARFNPATKKCEHLPI